MTNIVRSDADLEKLTTLSSQVSVETKSLKEVIEKSIKRVSVYVGVTRMERIAQLDVDVGTALN